MQCTDFEQRMHELLDRHQLPEGDSDLQEHAAACSECRLLLAGQRLLFAGLREHVSCRPPHGFAERAVSAAITRRRMRAFGPLLAAAAVAASLAFWLVPHRAGESPAAPAVAQTPAGARNHESGAAQVPPSTAERQIDTEAYRQLIQGLFVHVHRLPQLEPVDQIAGSIRPLASTFNKAIDILWRGTIASGQGTEAQESSVRYQRGQLS